MKILSLPKCDHVGPPNMLTFEPKMVSIVRTHSLILGPLHTRAKSRDHEIVRAQKKVSKGRPNTPPKSCSVVTDPQV